MHNVQRMRGVRFPVESVIEHISLSGGICLLLAAYLIFFVWDPGSRLGSNVFLLRVSYSPAC